MSLGRVRPRTGRSTAFLLVAFAFTVTMLGTTLPTPLYPLYQDRFGFGRLMVTVIYALYAVGVITALLLFGSLSDQIGRRRTLLPGLLLSALSALVFLVADGVAALFIGRLLSGLSVGVFTGAATAALVDLAAENRQNRASLVAAAANMGGLGLGPLLAGTLAQYGPQPLRLCFLVNLGLLGLAATAIWLIPGRAQPEPGFGGGEHAPNFTARTQPEPGFGGGEHTPNFTARTQPEPGFGGGEHAPNFTARTQPEPHFDEGEHTPGSPRLAPHQGPPRLRILRLRVPAGIRATFFRAVTGGFAGFAVLGVFTALTPAFLGQVLHRTDHALTGLVVFIAFASSTVGQFASTALTNRTAMLTGCAGLALGSAVMAASLAGASLPLLVAAATTCGLSQGMVLRAGLTMVNAASPSDRRGEVASSFFIVLYVALSIPVVGVGAASQRFSLVDTGMVFAGLVGLLALAGFTSLLRTR